MPSLVEQEGVSMMNFGSGGDFFDDDADVSGTTPSAKHVSEVVESLPDVVGDYGEDDDASEDADIVLSHPMPDVFLGMPSFGESFGSIASDDDDEYETDGYPDEEDIDEASDAEGTQGLSEVRRASKKTSITRVVIVSLVGIVGIVLALGAFMLLMKPFGTSSASSQSVSRGQVDEQSVEPSEDADERMDERIDEQPEGAGEQKEESKASKEEPKSGSAMLDEISDTGHGYGVTKLLADPTSATISLRGRIKNLGDDVRKNVAIGVYLYDRDGSVIGVATGLVDRIKPGATAEFVATSDVATSDVANVVLAEVRW